MSEPFRTASGGRVRRDRPIAFRFDGQHYTGRDGDTLASALLANDVHLVARSFKYHRPRGIMAAGAEEPNALVTVDRGAGRVTPNLRATQIALYDGLQAHSQNRWPSLRFDLGATADRFSALLSAGFYYKTFMWPPVLWRKLYEPAIRAAAGLGRAPRTADSDRYLHHYAHCEVLVIGGGPAGLAAALAASANGARVILCDEQEEIGGSLMAETEAVIDGNPAASWLDATLAALGASGSVTLLPRTTAFGWFADNFIGLAERVTDHLAAPDPRLPRERLWQVRAAAVVLAAGAIERPLVFPHNDRPGVMLADAARVYLRRYGVKVGGRVMVATTEDSAYRAALALHGAGVTIAGIADARPAPDSAAVTTARDAGLQVFAGTAIAGTSGRLRLRDVLLSDHAAALRCDTLLTCGGWTPSVHLFSQSRGKLRFDDAIGAFVPGETAARIHCAGACAGTFGPTACLDEGYAAGEAAIRSHAAPRRFAVSGTMSCGTGGLQHRTAPHGKAFVDLQNDVTTKDLRIATREGFHSIEHVKRYTTAGMATDQGKTSNLNALAAVAGMLRQPVPAVGHTTYRMPYTPVTFGTLAGAARGMLLDPVRQTPLHAWAAAHGAVFEDAGAWKRARCFPRAGEDEPAAVARECRAVRNAVGLLDASTLGKIEVAGPDAAQFLDLLYTIDVASLAPGRCRYALLLGENGFVLDDGIIARLAPDRFHITTTTRGAASVLHHMEDYRQTEFSHLRVWLTSTTEQWGVIAVQGPQARAAIAPLVKDLDLAAMPHMSVRACRVAGVAARLFRASFTGELGYEINVPAGFTRAVWDAVLAAGAPFGITPYGTEAMHVLRAEKGFFIVGQETDGTVTPDDLGLAWMVSRRKRDFVGKRSLTLPDMVRADRRQLAGLLTTDARVVLQEGAQVVADMPQHLPAAMLGHVTSSYWSDTLHRSIALALVSGGRARIGSTLYVPMPDRVIPVTVAPPVFHDGEGQRLHG
ncbi:MAG TPA: sarcosine oxidase subunit alpha family protein [Acetobacteraceae bacterium]|nr:sarcosine oxidase subunit alpha family protein [Acetobacteraceae bacterium]